MGIKLYGSTHSPFVQLVALVAAQVGFSYELVILAAGDIKSATYLEKHPFSQVPCLDDDGFIVYESQAIARYVAEKGQSGGLIPPVADHRARALFEQAVSVEISNFEPHVRTIVVERIVKPRYGGAGDEARAEEALSTLLGKLEGYERILKKQKYMAGEQLTLADLFHLPLGSMLMEAGVSILSDSEKFPNVARWWAEISSLPSWKSVQG